MSSFRNWSRPGPTPPGGIEPGAGETLDFICGDFRIFQFEGGHRYSTDDVLTACTRAKAELRSVFETNQMESIFELVRSGFGLSVVPKMASSNAAGCTLVRLHTKSFRRIGYIRARRHLVSRPMREFISWLRSIARAE